MDILNELRTKASQVEVVNVQSESTTIGFEANKLKRSQAEETKGVAVRVVKDGRLGFAASSNESETEKLMTNVLESADYGDEIPIAFPAPQSAVEVTTFDQTITKVSITRMKEIGEEIVDLILQIEPDARVNVELDRGVQHLLLRNQAGTEVSFKRSPPFKWRTFWLFIQYFRMITPFQQTDCHKEKNNNSHTHIVHRLSFPKFKKVISSTFLINHQLPIIT